MSYPRVKLSDLTIAVESSSMEDEHLSRFDRETGEMVFLEADVLRCADGREFLCDTSASFSLDQNVIDDPPVILWPEAKQNADVPADVQKLLAAIVR